MKISVICPVYNARANDLALAAQSVLGQINDGELLLIDDASISTETLTMLKALEYTDPRVRLLRLLRNTGPGAARTLGLDAANGDWIGFVDADDTWYPRRIDNARDLIAQNPEIRWIIGDIADHGVAGRGLVRAGASCFDLNVSTECASPTLTQAIILDGLHLGACLIRRDAIGLRRFDPDLTFAEDMVFLVKLSLKVSAHRSAGLSYICQRQHESLMRSSKRLTSRFVQGWRKMASDPELAGFRRPIRWRHYSVLKDLAMNNLANGLPWAATKFACRAHCLDPREVKDAICFVRMLFNRTKIARFIELSRIYSGSELISVSRDMRSRIEEALREEGSESPIQQPSIRS